MENDRENMQVIMSIQKAAMLMDPFFKLTMMGTAFLITYFARLAKEGKISRGEFYSVQDFMKATEGKYTIANVPYDNNYSPWEVKEIHEKGKIKYTVRNSVSGEILKGKEGKDLIFRNRHKADLEMIKTNNKEKLVLNELKEIGIRHVILPDLNRDDGCVQIAVFNEDREMFAGWQERYLISRMQGGEQTLRDLQNLTNGNTSLISIPVEGDMLDQMKRDFINLKINYAILPDLNVGDGEIQLAIANTDVPNVQFWMQMYNQDLMNRGEMPKEMKNITLESYRRTGEMTEEQYAETATADIKKANEKYEGKEPGVIEKTVQNQDKGIRSVNCEEYGKFRADEQYVEISIDRSTLIDNSRYAADAELKEKGLFVCRIPGTYAEHEQTLVIPENRVFSLNGDRTYRAFLKKDEKPFVIGPEGSKLNKEQSGMDLKNKYFDSIEKKQEIGNTKKTEKGHMKNFNNFQKRNYDFESLERAMLRK